ncbi:hypothetical protein [Deinococcus peraridilitoris]|uniref:Uncharacterized protein n=1 Tax=Deinococcus peraridilitoris (strain DSM 19664 / LMG 22246 / CIP 109416 / KR-200) TaxID=937777 RepID=L0A0T2_DEIPD|nr:hypothetical protein [Deinococcus peraridilitoris]AFZ67456.1 hypothetical protein Deipe_1953 [Deinococcus peraridilitoris DSM 19664]
MTLEPHATVRKARKLLNLYRNSSGGEQAKTRAVLRELLEKHGLTLADLEPHLPRSTDVTGAEAHRAADTHLLALSVDDEETVSAALAALVDEPDLSEDERRLILSRLSISKLVEALAPGWLHALADDEVEETHLLQAARSISEETVLAVGGMSIKDTVQGVVTREARRLARPERVLRAQDPLHAVYLAELCRLLARIPARVVQENAQWTVRAHISAHELGQVRALTDREALSRALERAAREAAQAAFGPR